MQFLGYKANFNTIFKIGAKSAFSFDNDEQRHLLRQFLIGDGLYEALQKAFSLYLDGCVGMPTASVLL